METTTSKPTGQPIIVSDQPATNVLAVDPDKKATTGQSAIDAAKAKISAKAAPVVVTAAPAVAAPAAAAPAEVTDEAIAKAADTAKALVDVKATVLDPTESFADKAKRAEALAATDPLKALEILGIPLDAAVRQATGAPATTTEEQKLRDENKALKEQIENDKRTALQATAQAVAQAQYHATTAAIVADKELPNITTPAQVSEALKPAQDAYRALVAEVGRPLNETEKDRLVRVFLKRYNDSATAATTPAAKDEPTVKAGTVTPARAVKRTIAQVKADILAKKKTN